MWGAPSDGPDPVFQPTTFGKYFLTRRIAVGGMAEVFAAKLYGADGFEKDLVIKQILPQHARDPEFVQSFVAEAKIAVSLNHANIVAIYELGRVDGTYFIAMEYVDGMDLYAFVDACRRHGIKIDPGHALYAVEEVAKGLDYAHRGLGPDGQPLGLVHRDLNPRNVLASKQGEIKILDFGIAKVRSTIAEMPKTRAGVVKGTTGYMSPEQAMGLEVDARTDIYQAGLLLYEMLTGQPLFWRPDDESTRALMRRHDVRPVSAVVPGLSSDIDDLVFAALARNPDDRIVDATTLVRHLAQLRYRHYPTASAGGLGLQVARLAALEAQADATVEPEIPATEELSAVISRAIEQSIGAEVETIARSDIAPRDRPTTGSEPISLASDQSALASAVLSADLSPTLVPSVIPPAPASAPHVVLKADGDIVTEAPTLEGPVDAPAGLRTRFDGVLAWANEQGLTEPRSLRMIAGGLVGAVFIVIVWLVVMGPSDAGPAEGPSAQPNPAEAAVRAPTKQATPAPTKEPSPAREAPKAPVDKAVTPPPPPKPDTSGAQASVRRSAATGFATVAFGTRSCSSRVSLDGKVIARSTPSFDHRVPAGMHIVVVEGVGCPPIERPGSLQLAIPTVRQQIEVEPGTSLKVIADFEQNTLTLRTR